jgi:hypothetical protein
MSTDDRVTLRAEPVAVPPRYFGRLILHEGTIAETSMTGTFVLAVDVAGSAPSPTPPHEKQVNAKMPPNETATAIRSGD